METDSIHTVKPLTVDIPKHRLTVITGVSGSGKTTMVLESLVPALEALCYDKRMPDHIQKIEAEGIHQVKLIDATPIGVNVRSTVATYANVHDELRKIYGRTAEAKRLGSRPATFPITREVCAARSATERARSPLTFSSFPMWIFPVRSAAGRAMESRRS